MGRETVLFKSEERKSLGEVAAVLRQVADKVEQGSISLGQGDSKVVLDFPGTLTLEIKAEEEEKRHRKRSLEIELEWAVGIEEEAAGLVIG